MVIALIPDDETLLTATANGYGQRTELTQYRAIGRGGQGVISIITNDVMARLLQSRLMQQMRHS